MKMSNYWNEENDEVIICPYCGKKYEPSYEECYIGGKTVDCYTEYVHEYTCDCCGKRFVLQGYRAGWRYVTETIDGQATEEEAEEKGWT